MDGYFIFHGRLNLREFRYSSESWKEAATINYRWKNEQWQWMAAVFQVKSAYMCIVCTRIFRTYMAMWHSTWKKSSATLTDLMNESVIFWCTEMSVLIMIITIIKFGECHLHISKFECNSTELNQRSTKYEWWVCVCAPNGHSTIKHIPLAYCCYCCCCCSWISVAKWIFDVYLMWSR